MKLTQLEKIAIHGSVLQAAFANPQNFTGTHSGTVNLSNVKCCAEAYIKILESDQTDDHPNDTNGH